MTYKPNADHCFHGDDLVEALANTEAQPPFLVEELLAEDASFMLCSDGAVGKSVITLSALASMSAGLPVWGQFKVPKPLRVYFVMGERTWREPMRRLKRLPAGSYDPENLWITDHFSGTCNLMLNADADKLMAYLNRTCPGGPNLLVLDPLYPFVSGALSEDRVGNNLTRQLSRIKSKMGCTLWLNHHNVKPRMGDDGKAYRNSNPMYGSVWLYNHLTTQYSAERETQHRTILRVQKDNWEVQIPQIPLDYDPEGGEVTMSDDLSPVAKGGRVRLFLQDKSNSKEWFTKSEVIRTTGVSEAQWYRIIGAAPWKGRLERSQKGVDPIQYRVLR